MYYWRSISQVQGRRRGGSADSGDIRLQSIGVPRTGKGLPSTTGIGLNLHRLPHQTWQAAENGAPDAVFGTCLRSAEANATGVRRGPDETRGKRFGYLSREGCSDAQTNQAMQGAAGGFSPGSDAGLSAGPLTPSRSVDLYRVDRTSGQEGTANIDFVLFRDRWMVAEKPFRPPWYP